MRLACENLTVAYQHPVIHHLSCDFKLGSTTAIIGPNGAGKSTLLKAILGEIKPESGKIILEGLNRSNIAYLPQVTEIDASLPFTVEDVVLLGCWYNIGLLGKTNKSNNSYVDECLNQVGLNGFRKRYINELSRGQMQRVLVARILMQQAKVIILDEPFNAMDSQTTNDLLQLIKQWQHDGKTIIAVLHDLHQVARFFEYTLLIAKEQIAYDKTRIVLNRANLEKAYTSSFIWFNEDEACDIIESH